MWVVKLGGSLMGTPALKGLLDALVQFGDGKVVIVPGVVCLPMPSVMRKLKQALMTRRRIKWQWLRWINMQP